MIKNLDDKFTYIHCGEISGGNMSEKDDKGQAKHRAWGSTMIKTKEAAQDVFPRKKKQLWSTKQRGRKTFVKESNVSDKIEKFRKVKGTLNVNLTHLL